MKRQGSALLLAFFILLNCFLPLLSSCGFIDLEKLPAFINPQIGKKGGLYIDGKLTEYIEPEYESEAYKSFDEMQKKLYCSAYTALDGVHSEFKITGVDFDRYFDEYAYVLTTLFADHPEFFWFNGYVEAQAEYMQGSDLGNITFTLGVYDYWKDSDISSAAKEFEAKVDSIVNEVSLLRFDDDYGRVKYIHDMLIENVRYDYESYYESSVIDAKTDAFINSAYGPLMVGDALCGGYAQAFSLLMHKLGIECVFVTGVADGGSHAWNLIKLGGEYYHIDLTWDDPDGDPCDVLYSYFCVTNEDIYKTHTVDPEYEYIEATATEYNYYIREGLYLEFYNFSTIKNMFQSFEGDVLLTFKCANKYVFNEAVENLIDKQRIYELEGMSELQSYSYAIDNEHYILTFFID